MNPVLKAHKRAMKVKDAMQEGQHREVALGPKEPKATRKPYIGLVRKGGDDR